jgi:hypothetical protein
MAALIPTKKARKEVVKYFLEKKKEHEKSKTQTVKKKSPASVLKSK